jgi:undecaprenyl-diphosphatase
MWIRPGNFCDFLYLQRVVPVNIIQAIILAFIEGLTEFLPVSSTGHMVVAASLMDIANDDFTKLFVVAIQLGAILSVLVLYSKRFLTGIPFYYKLCIAFLPSVVLGLLLNDIIDNLLESPVSVAVFFILGGIIFLKTDVWFQKNSDSKQTEPETMQSFRIGLFQCLAMFPGVSRSAATIIGGMIQGLNRKTAAEFSFFLAVPTMFAATAYKLYKYISVKGEIHAEEIKLLAIGNVVAFLVAMIAIRGFVDFLSKKGFVWFGYYRILTGLIILWIHFFVHPLQLM